MDPGMWSSLLSLYGSRWRTNRDRVLWRPRQCKLACDRAAQEPVLNKHELPCLHENALSTCRNSAPERRQKVELFDILERFAALMGVIRPYLDLLRARIVVICGKHR